MIIYQNDIRSVFQLLVKITDMNNLYIFFFLIVEANYYLKYITIFNF